MVEAKPLVDLIRPSTPLEYRKPIHIAIGLWVDFSKKKVLHFKAMSRSVDLGHRCCKETPRSCEEQTMAYRGNRDCEFGIG